MNSHLRLWMLRAGCLLVALTSGGVVILLAQHRSTSPVIGSYSLVAFAALVVATVTAGGSVLLGLLPARVLSRLVDWSLEGYRELQRAVPSGTVRHGLMLGAIALVSYFVIATRMIAANEFAVDDQRDYLELALAIRGSGGVFGLVRQLLDGTFPEANRHPLYLALLSIRPDFEWGKWISCLIGIVPFVLVFYRVGSGRGWLVAGVAATLLASNSVFQQSASLIACEMLLVTFSLCAWFMVDRSVSDRTALSSGDWSVRSAWMGLWLGLAYLAKASGLFLVVGYLGWSLFQPGLRRWSWLAAVSFAIVAMPLLVRNIRVYGDPIHSFNTRFLFADSFESGLARTSRGVRADAAEYLRTHSARDVAARAVGGLGWEGFILFRSLGPATLGPSKPLVGLVLFGFALIGMLVSEVKRVALAATWCTTFYIFFSWYVPIASGDRFLAPIVPVLLVFAAQGVVTVITCHARSERGAVRIVVVAALLWCTTAMTLSARVTSNSTSLPNVTRGH